MFCLFSGIAFSQTKNDVIQQRIEFISEQLEAEDLDLTGLFDNLSGYYDRPLNLNSASADELRDLQLLTDVQINDLLIHRERYGKLISIYELQSLKYWDMLTIYNVLPFIYVTDRLDQVHLGLKELLKQGKGEFYARYQLVPEHRQAYDDVSDSLKESSSKYYRGDPARVYSRFRFSYKTNFSIGFTAEKDPGEELFRGSQKQGFDFYSAHAYYRGGKYVRRVALGDYQMQIGQGLNFWSGFAFGKSADVSNIKKNAYGLKAYTSVDETRFLRGAGIELGVSDFSLTLFGSRKKVDASIILDTLAEDLEFVSSINLTGLHRTTSELAKKDGLTETIAGAYAQYKKRSLSIGLAGVYHGYDKDYSKTLIPYNQFDFRGNKLINLSADYNYVYKNFNFFGEVSRSSTTGAFAFLQGIVMSLDSRASFSLLYRDYAKDYQFFYAEGFAEGSKAQNEKGMYAGASLKLDRSWTFNTYVDVFKFPWLKFQIDAPSVGHEVLGQLTYKPSRAFQMYFRVREQQKQKNSRNQDATITEIEDVRQRNYRFNLSAKLSDGLQWKSRIEYVTINRPSNTPESGLLISQDLLIKPKSWPVDLALRYALFDTDSYDSRIYTFENNALYVFSSPSYYYKGSRAYALVRWTFFRRCDLWFRYGVYLYGERQSTGSGGELIEGSKKSDITIQFRVKF